MQDAIQAQMVIQKMSELVTDNSGPEDQLTSISENPTSEGSATTADDSPIQEEQSFHQEDEANANLEFKSAFDSENNVPVSSL